MEAGGEANGGTHMVHQRFQIHSARYHHDLPPPSPWRQ